MLQMLELIFWTWLRLWSLPKASSTSLWEKLICKQTLFLFSFCDFPVFPKMLSPPVDLDHLWPDSTAETMAKVSSHVPRFFHFFKQLLKDERYDLKTGILHVCVFQDASSNTEQNKRRTCSPGGSVQNPPQRSSHCSAATVRFTPNVQHILSVMQLIPVCMCVCSEDAAMEPLDACRIHGHIYINKVAGNLHITVGK